MSVHNVIELPALEEAQVIREMKGRSIPAEESVVLYIGKNDLVKSSLTGIYKVVYAAENIRRVKEMLSTKSKKVLFDVILIDFYIEEPQNEDFLIFLQHLKCSTSTLVIYNEQKIAGQLGLLKQIKQIDDIVNFGQPGADLLKRVNFLKTLKHQALCINKKVEQDNLFNNPLLEMKFLLKRILDVVIACMCLLILLPVFVIIAVLIKLDSKGPIIYTSKRAGKGFKVFKFYKFRTMEVNADKKIEALAHLNQYDVNESGPKFFKLNNDPRITRFGKFLRNSSLDELPQLLNVLKGDMSLVGNRPLPLYEAATLTTNEFVERFVAPSGITGLWQIKKRGKPTMSTEERVNLDIRYARKYNILYDFWIIIQTPRALFQKSDV